MGKILAFLAGRKTYITAISGLVIGIASLAGIALPGGLMLSHDAALQAILTALTGAFLRAGVAKNGK